MAREIEAGGIPIVVVSSWPGISENNGIYRTVRGYGITHPMSTPFLTPEEETAQRRAILEAALDALQQTPTKPTVWWPNFGNCIGSQMSVGVPTVDAVKDWDWTTQ